MHDEVPVERAAVEAEPPVPGHAEQRCDAVGSRRFDALGAAEVAAVAGADGAADIDR